MQVLQTVIHCKVSSVGFHIFNPFCPKRDRVLAHGMAVTPVSYDFIKCNNIVFGTFNPVCITSLHRCSKALINDT